MREITSFLDEESAKALAAICAQTKTAAAWQAQEFLNEANQKTSKIFVLTEVENNTKTVLGFCAVRFVFENAEITNFAVLPSQQRKHLGTELFAHTLNFLK
ncbi:MAG: GNAT family N-acetyltransferase, partial [Elusimicrobiaceae bacterium]|nr:GNAT family N-acetyltransferase [Elusimicrobiaceae bacterium]